MVDYHSGCMHSDTLWIETSFFRVRFYFILVYKKDKIIRLKKIMLKPEFDPSNLYQPAYKQNNLKLHPRGSVLSPTAVGKEAYSW